jgi:hypothetical protein
MVLNKDKETYGVAHSADSLAAVLSVISSVKA